MAAAKKCRRRVVSTGVLRDDINTTGVLRDDMVWEILTWLPTKSLMRFKSVSKLWLSTILDPNFARAHRSPLRGLLVMNPDPYPVAETSRPTREFFFANFDDAVNLVDFSFQFSLPNNLRRFRVSNIMNGIVCFYNLNVAKLFNIATREIINLPNSRCVYYSHYHVLFDPIQNVYKLLKICQINEVKRGNLSIHSIECEILTLGVDLSWRSIQPPPNGIMSHGICVDGVLHLMMMVPSLYGDGHFPPCTFNVTGEKFESVNYPKNIFLRLLAFGIIPVLATCYPHPTPNHTVIAASDYWEGSWTNVNKYTVDKGDLLEVGELLFINTPQGVVFYLASGEGESLQVRGSLPNGSLMISDTRGLRVRSGCGSGSGGGSRSRIYLFDKIKNDLQTYTLRFPTSTSEEDCCCQEKGGGIFWYEENIISLKALISSS